MASIRHPNIVAVYDCGVAEGRALRHHGARLGPHPRGHHLRRRAPSPSRRPSRSRSSSSTASAPPTSAASSTATSSRPTCSSRPTGTLKILDFGISRADADGPLGPESQVRHVRGHARLHGPRAVRARPHRRACRPLRRRGHPVLRPLRAHTPFDLDVPPVRPRRQGPPRARPRASTSSSRASRRPSSTRSIAASRATPTPVSPTRRPSAAPSWETPVAFSPTVASRPGAPGSAPHARSVEPRLPPHRHAPVGYTRRLRARHAGPARLGASSGVLSDRAPPRGPRRLLPAIRTRPRCARPNPRRRPRGSWRASSWARSCSSRARSAGPS
jgi:hypothetical protein